MNRAAVVAMAALLAPLHRVRRVDAPEGGSGPLEASPSPAVRSRSVSIEHNATGDLRAGSARLGVASPASQFIGAARDFCEGVDAVADNARLWRVRAFLAGQSLECALKAYLSHDGATERELKNEYGHDLGKAWREAAKRDLGIPKDPPEWCVLLDSVHDAPYLLRYPSAVNGYVLPNGRRLADELARLIDTVAEALELD